MEENYSVMQIMNTFKLIVIDISYPELHGKSLFQTTALMDGYVSEFMQEAKLMKF